jgi:hypothetical protein
MSQTSSIESRIAALISAYADRAPIDVDAVAMARHAAAGSARRRWQWAGFGAAERGLAYLLLILGLLISIVTGTLVAGSQLRDDPLDILTGRDFVEPFIGLPPEGAPPSSPETGELVLSFYGRVSGIGNEVHGMWLYADGRLIWRRALEGGNRSAFGTAKPTRGVVEQRLTPEGVALLLSQLEGATPEAPWIERPGPGVWWGEIQVRQGDGLENVSWSDRGLPVRLADPGSWLLASAWADREIRGYVPSRYAVCPMSSSGVGFDRLPAAARDILLAGATLTYGKSGLRCYVVETSDARAIAGILDSARFPRADRDWYLAYRVPPGSGDQGLFIIGILPHGEAVGYGS